MIADLIKQFEGCSFSAYRDLDGVPTVGYGHTGKDVYMGLMWNQEMCDQALEQDIATAQAQLAIYSPGLTDGHLEALTDFVYNIGIGNYRTSTLCKYVNAQAWPQVKTELLKWDHSNGIEVDGLLKRREAEAALIP